jgi:elongation factor G
VQHTVKGCAPLRRLVGYATDLRSLTAGEVSFSMRFSHYGAVPPQDQSNIVATMR